MANSRLIKTAGIDHVGINVPSADDAASFFEELFGTRIVSDMHPGPIDREWKRRFRWHPSAELFRIVMLRAPDGSQIELFEYAGPDGDKDQPHQDDAGATHVAFRVDDTRQAFEALTRRGLTTLNEPVTNPDGVSWFYFLTPWNSQIELVSQPT